MYKSILHSLLIVIYASFLFSCSGTKRISDKPAFGNRPTVVEPNFFSLLSIELDSSIAINKSLYGVVFYDMEADTIIWEHNPDKYFIPASNAKIFSLYVSDQILEDSIIAYKYDFIEDTLVIKANGDPSFLHHYTKTSLDAFNRLKHHNGPIKLYQGNFEDAAFGTGWAWDDYSYYYQAEKSPFPIYGNTVRFQKLPTQENLLITPKAIDHKISFISDSTSRTLQRDFGSNQWILNKQKLEGRSLDHEIPFKYEDAFEELLEDTISSGIQVIKGLPNIPFNHIQYSVAKHEMLKWMMDISDNFYAEQLMIMCSNTLFDTMSVTRAIQYAQDSLFAGIPDSIKWVDGSGLSRYNLFTPRSIVWVLQKFNSEKTNDEIQYYFPKIDFISDQEVYAKTGALSNNRCLSGFLYTKSNKKIIFSIMVNHYLDSTSKVNEEVGNLIRVFGEKY